MMLTLLCGVAFGNDVVPMAQRAAQPRAFLALMRGAVALLLAELLYVFAIGFYTFIYALYTVYTFI